jgi:hypothetical protein
MIRFLIAVVVAGVLGYGAFITAFRKARRSPARRRALIAGNAVALALGLVLALWLPMRMPETSGSPASLVAILLLWLVGGCLAFLGLAALLGAVFARTPSVHQPSATSRS